MAKQSPQTDRETRKPPAVSREDSPVMILGKSGPATIPPMDDASLKPQDVSHPASRNGHPTVADGAVPRPDDTPMVPQDDSRTSSLSSTRDSNLDIVDDYSSSLYTQGSALIYRGGGHMKQPEANDSKRLAHHVHDKATNRWVKCDTAWYDTQHSQPMAVLIPQTSSADTSQPDDMSVKPHDASRTTSPAVGTQQSRQRPRMASRIDSPDTFTWPMWSPDSMWGHTTQPSHRRDDDPRSFPLPPCYADDVPAAGSAEPSAKGPQA